MPVPSSITDLIQTAGSNSPAGGDSVFPNLDNYIRAIESFIAVLRDGKGLSAELDVASSGTCDIGASNSPFARITGTTTITSFGTNYNGPRYLRFAEALILTHSSTLVLPGAANITTVAGDTCVVIPGATSGTADKWVVVAYQRASGEFLTAVTRAQLQAQTYTAFTTGGTSSAFTLTPAPAITAYAENQTFDVEFNAASTGTPTLDISGLGAKSLKFRGPTGALVSVGTRIPSGWRSKVTYDGADMIVREMPPAEPAIAAYAAPVRQTVLSGPVDSNGLPNFGGSTGSTTVTMSGTLEATAAGGTSDRLGSITNAAWTGLSTNGTMYLYLTVNADGTCTTGSTTLRPNYQAAGTYSTTSGQSTFNVQEMTMKVGNGSSADQAYRVFVGEVTVSGSVVSAITWYALMGRYIGPWTATLPGTNTEVSASHNLGIGGSAGASYVGTGVTARFELRSDSTDAGYSAGDQIDGALCQPSAGNYARVTPRLQRLTAYVRTGANIAFVVTNASNGALAYTGSGLNSANWSYRFVVERTW